MTRPRVCALSICSLLAKLGREQCQCNSPACACDDGRRRSPMIADYWRTSGAVELFCARRSKCAALQEEERCEEKKDRRASTSIGGRWALAMGRSRNTWGATPTPTATAARVTKHAWMRGSAGLRRVKDWQWIVWLAVLCLLLARLSSGCRGAERLLSLRCARGTGTAVRSRPSAWVRAVDAVGVACQSACRLLDCCGVEIESLLRVF